MKKPVPRKTRHSTAPLAIAAAFLASYTTAAFAQADDATPAGVTIPASSVANSADAGVAVHTNLQMLGSGDDVSGAPLAVGPPLAGLFYQTPASIACIYGLQSPVPGCNPYVATANPTGGRRAIAIVDAYDDPNAYADLQTFSAQFGVAPITPGSFTVVFAPPGGTTVGSCVGAALTHLYGDFQGHFTDITFGNCGRYMAQFAGPGWDFCSGLGSPNHLRGDD